jgi:hypothetical protein
MKKLTKQHQVLFHLKTHGNITSWEAINEYGATRLSHIIYVLRNDGHDIKTENLTKKDRNNNTVTYAKYVYNGTT